MSYNAPATAILKRALRIRTFSGVEKLILFMMRSKTIARRHKRSLISRIFGHAFENYICHIFNIFGCPHCQSTNTTIRLEKRRRNHPGSDLLCTNCKAETQVKHNQGGILGDKKFDLGSARQQKKLIRRVKKKKLYLAVGNWNLYKILNYKSIKITFSKKRTNKRARASFRIKENHRPLPSEDMGRIRRTRYGVMQERNRGSDCWKDVKKKPLTTRFSLV